MCVHTAAAVAAAAVVQGPVRAALQPDTVQVLDAMIAGTAAEADMVAQTHAAAETLGFVQAHTQIEELM
jgi:hypothetical protein